LPLLNKIYANERENLGGHIIMLKKLLVVLLLFVAVSGTAGAYAYWDDLTRSQEETLMVGEGTSLELAATVTAPEGKVLVPAGVVMKANDVDSIVLKYQVSLDKEANEDLLLSSWVENVMIGESSDLADELVNISIELEDSTVNAKTVEVTVTITLNEPATQDIYNEIINQDITFRIFFQADQAK
jgi:hypothetical protein